MKAGEFISLEEGEYSSYTVKGFFKVLKDFEPKEAAEGLRAKWKPEHKWEVEPSTDSFHTYLLAEGYIEDIEYTPLNIGSYGSLELDS